MTQFLKDDKEKKEALKSLIKRLHQGEDMNKLKEEFKELIKTLTPLEISQVEGELVREGLPQEELRKFCDLHIATFRESLEKEGEIAPPGHPVNILMGEHKELLKFSDELRKTSNLALEEKTIQPETLKKLNHIIKHLKEAEKHYLREENILFPSLEKHGITQPPAIMWMEHDQIRGLEKEIYKLVEQLPEKTENLKQLSEKALALADLLSSHFYKENKILFPTALRVITEEEWTEIRSEFDNVGYCCFTPPVPKQVIEKTIKETEKIKDNKIILETGEITVKELNGILNTLPFEITFVDKNDVVKYFIPHKETAFLRTKAIIGRKVQNCHPKKSIHIVNQILDDFKTGKRDKAEFWINFKGKFLHINYYPVRNKKGEYLGCIEITQDITEIRKLKGEKRLLD
ncbi:MAG: DUF438 domain-containing protein [Candidatus Odinarchaeia archaeon]